MASTSPLLTVFSQDRSTTTGSKVLGGSSNNNNSQDASKSTEQPASKLPRGRKPNKSSKSPMNKNKPTRRGMGVAKLERWLEAEKMGSDHHHNLPVEVAAGFPLHHPHPHQFHRTPPLIPVAASSPSSVYVGSDLLMMSMSSSSSSFMAASSNKVITTLGCGGGGKELSSIPKVVMQYHHQCDASCYSKNKCMNMDDDEMQGMILGGVNNNQDKQLVFPTSSLINCHMLIPGLNHGHNFNVGLQETNEFNNSSRVMKQIYHQDSEVMGITRPQVISSSSCSTTLKEYEFFPPGKGLKEYELFPGTTSGRSYARSSEQPNHYSYNNEPAASSYFIPSGDFSGQYNATNSTNALDLSLKL